MAATVRPRVLVLEDEWLIAEQIEAAMEGAGYEVVGPVGRVGDALRLLADTTVDVAVLDINVHEERSFAVAAKLASTMTPFVFVSGYNDADLPPTLGDRPLMQKPVDARRLCGCIKSLLTPRA